MTAPVANAELPDEQATAYRKAKVLEWITLGFFAISIPLVYLVAGNSQAMKVAWIEDALSCLAPAAFLLATRYVRRAPTARRPYGYHRSVAVAHLVASTALFTMGGYLLVESAMTLIAADHPPIGVIVLFGQPIWLGWLMIAVMTAVGIPPLILGRIKLKLAITLQDKVLYADALTNRADWLTSVSTVIGVAGVGIGLWWADAVAAIVISYTIIGDGVDNLRSSVRDLMDARATQYDGTDPDPIVVDIVEELKEVDWIDDAGCRVRDQGRVLHVEVFVVPVKGTTPSLTDLDEVRRRCHELSWRIHDVVVVPTSEIEFIYRPHLNKDDSRRPSPEGDT